MPVSIPLPTDETLPSEIRDTLAQLPPLNIFRMMANAPASFRPFLDLASSVLIQSAFDARKREIAVLRVGHVTGSRYEWTQHVRLARNLGVTDAEMTAIVSDGPVTGLDDEGNLLCRVADEISRDVRLSDDALRETLQRYGVQQATELILCVSYFNMVSRFLESARVELEAQDLIGSQTPAEVVENAARSR